MDIVEGFTDQGFNEIHKARGVNPISIGDQNNRLGAVDFLGSILVGFYIGVVPFRLHSIHLFTLKNFLKVADEARRQ